MYYVAAVLFHEHVVEGFNVDRIQAPGGISVDEKIQHAAARQEALRVGQRAAFDVREVDLQVVGPRKWL